MEVNPEIIVAVLGSGGIGFIGAKLWNAWSGSRRKDGAQSHSQYMELFQKQNERIAHLEADNDNCRDENSKMNRELGALREAVTRLESVNVHAVITCDAEEGICTWNHGATVLFGWAQDEVIGKNAEIIIPQRIRAQHHAAFQRALTRSEDEPMAVIQLRDSYGLRRDGTEIPITIHLRRWRSGETQFFSAEIQKRT